MEMLSQRLNCGGSHLFVRRIFDVSVLIGQTSTRPEIPIRAMTSAAPIQIFVLESCCIRCIRLFAEDRLCCLYFTGSSTRCTGSRQHMHGPGELLLIEHISQ